MDLVDDLLRRWLVEDPTARTMLGSGAPQPMRVNVEPGTLPVAVSFYDGSKVTLAPLGPTPRSQRPRLDLACTCEAAKPLRKAAGHERAFYTELIEAFVVWMSYAPGFLVCLAGAILCSGCDADGVGERRFVVERPCPETRVRARGTFAELGAPSGGTLAGTS